MGILDWILIIGIALILLATGGYYIVKIAKMSPEERKNLIVSLLIGMVTMAEQTIKEKGAGAQKLEMVISEFNKRAPILCKMIMKFTKTDSLTELIEKALEIAKNTWK